MKFKKILINIVLIFAVIQLVGMVFTINSTYCNSGDFMQEVTGRASQWKNMGSSQSESILANSTAITGAVESIANFLRIICAGLILVSIAMTFIKLNSDETGEHKAKAKNEIIFLVILAIIFIFANQIINFFIGIFDQFENLASTSANTTPVP